MCFSSKYEYPMIKQRCHVSIVRSIVEDLVLITQDHKQKRSQNPEQQRQAHCIPYQSLTLEPVPHAHVRFWAISPDLLRLCTQHKRNDKEPAHLGEIRQPVIFLYSIRC